MGLDQYAYVAQHGQRDEFYKQELVFEDGQWVRPTSGIPEPREIAYWRKHPNLQGWMERLWLKKLGIPISDEQRFIEGKYPTEDFNNVELELTWEDIEQLEKDIKSGAMAKLNTTGFFFGSPSDNAYYQEDMEFVKRAKTEIFCGLKVFYNSSW
jgi:hypothetical protein